MLARLLDRFATWALHKNEPGPYRGEQDKRWAYFIETDGDKYLLRVKFPWRILGVQPYLHKFLRPDADRWLHNHPWKWAFSVILSGSYTEQRLPDDAWDLARLHVSTGLSDMEDPQDFAVEKRVKHYNRLTAADYHRVTEIHGDVWTLFITGPEVQDWGFLVHGTHIPWRRYFRIGQINHARIS